MKQNINRLFHLFRDELRTLLLLRGKWISLHRKPDPDEGPPRIRYFRAIVWVNIVCQLLFPLTLAFTPAIVAARQGGLSEDMSALQAGPDAAPDPVPVLMPPSSASQAAAPENSHLLLPDLGSDAAVKAEGGEKNEPQAVRDERERQEKLNQSMDAAQQLWGVLGGPSPRDQGLDRATVIASGMANQAAQDWLNQYGSARLSFSTQGTGSADILIPLVDMPDTLLFAQPGVRLSDDRTTGNIGLGARYFTRDWMLGLNSFYDNDFTGNNRRLGVGVEAWRDYLKLSANGYFRLSDWHQSPLAEMQDYDERPANGWDVRAEAWLPAYPQIGGKLMYEQYRGKNVSLDGSTGSQQDNPSALTVGLNWTPVSLIKVGVDHTTGSGTNNTSLMLDFSYRFGVPLSDQLSASSVAFGHSLAGSRYDLVDRNYDIVLQYRKQDLISLSLSASGSPYLGESVIVTANVTTKYGLDHVVWDAPAILAAGGSLVPLTAGTVRVTLPPASAVSRMSRAAAVSYDICAVAYDRQGNESNHAVLTLTPEKAPQDISSLVVTADNAVANGSARNTVEVTATDNLTGQPLTDTEVEITFTHTSGPADGKVLSVQTVKTDSNGRAQASVSAKAAGSVSVVAVLKRNGNSARTTMNFVADAAMAGLNGKPTVSGDNAVADGKSGIKVTFPVTDANGNPVINQTVTITTNNGAKPEAVTVTTDESGNATVTVTNTTAGTTTVTATVNGSTQSQDVNFIPGAPDADKSSFTADPVTLVANGMHGSVLTLTLRDAGNNPLVMSSGVSLALSGLQGVNVTSVSGAGGVYTATLTGVKAGTVTVTPVVKGTAMTTLARTITLTADGATAQISAGALTVIADNAWADDRATNSVQVVVTDSNGNPVSGVHVTFGTVSPAHIMVSDYATDSRGIATASLASTAAGSTPVTATVNGSSQTVNVKFTADSTTATLTAGSVKVNTTGAVANGTAQNGVKVKVTDANGNPVAGAEVAFSATNGARIGSAAQTGSDGTLIQSLTSLKAGTSTVTATVNGVSQSVSVAFVADSGSAQFNGSPGITGNGAPATGTDIIGVDFTVTDANGNPLVGQTVTITTNNGAQPGTVTVTTDSNGVAHVDVTSTTAGNASVTATVNGQAQTANVSFVADSASATLTAANLTTLTSNALANGTATNSVKVVVTDANGNRVPGVIVNFMADNGATIAGSGVSGADGTLVRTLTSTTAGASVVTATVNGTSQTTSVVFKADGATAILTAGNLTVVTTGAVANGTAQNSVKARVTDKYGNPVPGGTVTFAATNGATIAGSGATGADGSVTQTLTSTKAGNSTVTASVNGVSQNVVVSFVADATTAGLTATGAGLVTTLDNQAANGVAADTVKATVTDKNGNPVAGLAVTFSVTTGAVLTTTKGTTDSSGVATASVTSLKAGSYDVTATVNGSSKTVPVTFIADSLTAKFTDTPVISGDNAPADGISHIDVAYTVTDANGNPLAGQTVTVTASDGAQPGSITLVTDGNGVVTVSVTSIAAGGVTVTASTNGQTQPANITFVADVTTATIIAGNLKIVSDNATADGVVTNSVKVIVTDAKGNLVPGATVNFIATNGAIIAPTGITGTEGSVIQTLTSLKAGNSTVTATVNGHSQAVTLAFTADAITATLTVADGLKAGVNNAPANGTATNSVIAKVTDSKGNPVPGGTVNFTADNGATIQATGITGTDGTVTQVLTSKTAGTTQVTGGINGTTRSVTMTFVADDTTAGLDPAANPGSSLVTVLDNQAANGVATNMVTATVTDHNGNPVKGVTVMFSVTTGAVVTAVQGMTDSSGVATAAVTSLTAGAYTVTASVGGTTVTTRVTFVADDATADFAGTPVVNGNNAPANGADITNVDFTLKDASGNPVPGVSVVITTTNGAQPDTVTVTTDSNGVAHVDVTSTTPGVTTVTASVNGHTQTTDVTFIDPIASITVSGEVNGFPLVGTPLTATYTCVTTCPAAVAWQWRIETPRGSGVFVDIPGANTDSYTPVKGDQIRKVQAIATVAP